MTDFDYKWISFWIIPLYLLLTLSNCVSINRIKDLEQKVTQERNVAITLCVENLIACKTEYLKLK
jgi:hypothetical protein